MLWVWGIYEVKFFSFLNLFIESFEDNFLNFGYNYDYKEGVIMMFNLLLYVVVVMDKGFVGFRFMV